LPDQAENLREWARAEGIVNTEIRRQTKLVAVASGKGGVGKSNVTLNFALALQDMGQRIGIIDGDLGFSNLEILLGVRPRYNLQDVFTGQVDLRSAFTVATGGLTLISGGSGMAPEDDSISVYLARFAQELIRIDGWLDYLFIDFGGGFGRYTSEMMGLCDELLLITTPEPTSLTDAYALIKMMTATGCMPQMRLVVNRARTVVQANEAGEKFATVAQKFLHISFDRLGYVLEDEAVGRAVLRQVPFYIAEPSSAAARCIRQLAKNTLSKANASAPVVPDDRLQQVSGIKAFFERFVKRR